MDESVQVVALRGPRPEGAVPIKRVVPAEPVRLAGGRLPRRTVLKGAVVSGSALGMAALGVFPATRRAYADGYSILGSCPGYAAGHNCSPGCGPSPVYNDCCASTGYFRNGQSNNAHTAVCYLRPNQCVSGTGWDGWMWYYGGRCDRCSRYIEFRCHDGLRVWGVYRVKAICRWITRCG
jgi:hypothetical protein